MGFLDRRPFDVTHPDGRELLAALEAVYWRVSDVSALVSAAGLRLADFNWEAPMSRVWPQVLQEAADQVRLRLLVTVAARDTNCDAHEVIGRLAAQSTDEETPVTRQIAADRRRPGVRIRPTAYLDQVRHIAPPEPAGLIGRDAEMAELARFCVEQDCGPYVWWQAPAWAGKSALTSTFVLRPPPEVRDRVRVVSFFITARLGAQDNRKAFTRILIEQLAALTGEDFPLALPAEIQDGYLLSLLSRAARACQAAGQRLILLVDGMDEDRSPITGPYARSIAGLLPANPPAGMRIIVTGRPSPPVPDDVPDWHPLRDPVIVRPLRPSAHARDLQRLANQELRGLLRGTPGERDLLGLLTAARGGLTSLDLEELTGMAPWEVEDILHTVTGRTFTRRASQWRPGADSEVYLLGHEELQAAASRNLGRRRLADYRNRLHVWADAYRALDWPPRTPEYLLGGYYQLLVTQGDVARVVAAAIDPARHHRLLAMTGSDSAAMDEIRSAMEVISDQDSPDLAQVVQLAREGRQLAARSGSIPVHLPAVWAAIGQAARAEALATSIPDLIPQQEALAEVAGALAKRGQILEAEALARSLSSAAQQATALTQVATVLLEAGSQGEAQAIIAEAEALAISTDNPTARAHALADVAVALAKTGQFERAEVLARSSDEADPKAGWPAKVAGALAEAGQFELGESLAVSVPDSFWRSVAVGNVARALAAAGNLERAMSLARSVPNVSPRNWQDDALEKVAVGAAKAGQFEQAESLALYVADQRQHMGTLANVVGEMAKAGQLEQAERLARHTEELGHALPDDAWGSIQRIEVARALAMAEQFERAEVLARSLPYADMRASALVSVAGALADCGHFQQARKLCHEAEAAARSIPQAVGDASKLARLAVALAEAGQPKEAEVLARKAEARARTHAYPGERDESLAYMTAMLVQADQIQQALTLVESFEDPLWKEIALQEMVGPLAEKGHYRQAESLALSIEYPEWRVNAMVAVGVALANGSQSRRAQILIMKAKTLAQSVGKPHSWELGLAPYAGALAKSGKYQQAETLARSITARSPKASALAEVAMVLAKAGNVERAEELARSIDMEAWQAAALAEVAGALAESDRFQQAEALAQSIPDPHERAHAMVNVAAALAEAGQLQRAEGLIASAEITARFAEYPESQAAVLAEAALVLAAAGNKGSACRLTVASCAADWTAATKPILLLDPTAFTRLSRVI
jgi:tetratricopeptide (TPR) repeat protein